jgi:hypothetical protein
MQATDYGDIPLGSRKGGRRAMELLQLSLTMSHWSSGLSVCFPPWGQRFTPWGCNPHFVTRITCEHCPATLVTLMWLITGLALGSAPTMGNFTILRTKDVQSQLWLHIAFFVPFHSLQVLLLLATQWPVRAPVKLLGGRPVKSLQFYYNTQSHWSSGSTICSPSRVSPVRIPEMYPLSQWNRVSTVSVVLQWALWRPAIWLQHTVSLVQWVNYMLPI